MDIAIFIIGSFFLFSFLSTGYCNLVFPVEHKFKGQKRSLSALKAHDSLRHGRFLTADIELGGNGHPTQTGLYFAKIGLGTPPNDYYVQVDTGSDLLWVNCAGCKNCPKKSNLGIDLRLYNPASSNTSELITCDKKSCISRHGGPVAGCKSDQLCEYKVMYADGSKSTGYFVEDNLSLDQVTGDFQTAPSSGSVIFGCGAKQTGPIVTAPSALDGILGLGKANTSMVAQLASLGKVKNSFSHCFKKENGGGIFAIGEVVKPKVLTTPLVQQQDHYSVVMTGIEVDDHALKLPVEVLDPDFGLVSVVDTGTTLTYFPDSIYQPLMAMVFSKQAGLKFKTMQQQFTCFMFSGNVDQGFPAVTFHFEGWLTLTVLPHDYLFEIQPESWCVGWQSNGTPIKGVKDSIIFGDLVLQDKLVLYNLKDQTIGWVDYNCSNSIKVKDGSTGKTYAVGPHNLSSAFGLRMGITSIFLLAILTLLLPF